VRVIVAGSFDGNLWPRDPVTFVEPHSQIDESARERAEGAMGVAVPRDLSRAMRTMRVSDDAWVRPFHGAIVSAALLAVNLVTSRWIDDITIRVRDAM
jgi:hypothetical protein